MTPAVCVSALSVARCPVVATWHAAGALRWNAAAVHFWGFLLDRIDYRIGVLLPPSADAGGREDRVVFVGRHDPRKGLPVLLRAWPALRRRTGARLRL